MHTRVEIKDVCLAKEMQRVMAAEAEATRDARAKVVSDDEKLLLFSIGARTHTVSHNYVFFAF